MRVESNGNSYNKAEDGNIMRIKSERRKDVSYLLRAFRVLW
jgi:hypothetical protein